MKTFEPSIVRELVSDLFVVRMWNEDLGDGLSEWRAYVRHVPSGAARYVRSWQDLENFLGQYSDHSSERPDINEQSTK